MKPTKLVIKNIGKIADTTIDINKPLILFYGEIKQGKTTILNCVRWVCGGEFPDDIISHGAKEGEIELHFDGGMISRSFYRAKDGSIKARPVVFVKNGKPVSSPVAEIKRLLNPFLLDQDFLRNKNELERKQYFTELFAVDTTELDAELFNSQREAQALRAKIAGYGEIDLTKVEVVDASALREQRAKIIEAARIERLDYESQLEAASKTYQAKLDDWSKEVSSGRAKNATRDLNENAANGMDGEIATLEQRLSALKLKRDELRKWLSENPSLSEPSKPDAPDTTALKQKILTLHAPDTTNLDHQISDAAAQNVRAEQYQKNLKRAEEKRADEQKLLAMEKSQREIKVEKQAKLKSISSTSGIAGLEFDDAGNFIYDGTTAGMISDSQIMRLSSELSALYPDGFGIDLIDRAESLGKSIFEFVDKAKAENKSILATIVGERPAKVPENVGVFVVENGKLI